MAKEDFLSSFPFGARPSVRCELAVSFREGRFPTSENGRFRGDVLFGFQQP